MQQDNFVEYGAGFGITTRLRLRGKAVLACCIVEDKRDPLNLLLKMCFIMKRGVQDKPPYLLFETEWFSKFYESSSVDFFDFDESYFVYRVYGFSSFAVHCIKTGTELWNLKMESATDHDYSNTWDLNKGLLLTNDQMGPIR